MHLMIMHNSMLLEFSVVLIRITLLFSELGVLPQTLEPRRVERPFLSHANSFLHVRWNIFIKVFIKYYLFIICTKRKTYFRMMWIAIYTIVGWQWNHGMMLWWRFHCTGKYILRINYQCHSDPSAVLKRLPWDLLWTVKSAVSSLVHISSAGYYLVVSVAAANSVEARDLPTWRGDWNRSSGGVAG